MEPVMLGVKFMLQGNQFLGVALPEDEALKIFQDWLSGELHLRGSKRIGGTTPDGFRWALDITNIQAMHTFDLASAGYGPGGVASGMARQQPPGPGFPR